MEDAAPPVTIGVLIVASQGCRHAGAVVSEVRAQLDAADELVVVESSACDRKAGERHPAERHIAVGTHDESLMKVLGLPLLGTGVMLVLEDHGVPAPGFISALRALFSEHPDLDACTFFLRNGTPEDLPSRAVFAFVAGFADADSPAAVPFPVCSSFAIRSQALPRDEAARSAASFTPNVLEYEIIPSLANAGLDRLPRELTLTHFQASSGRQAATAIYWNARIAGSVQGGRLESGRATSVAKRYLGRAVLLHRVKRRSLPEAGMLGLLGGAGFVGWWTGRLLGPGRADDMIRAVHSEPAP